MPTPFIEAMENVASGAWNLGKAATMAGMPIEAFKARMVVYAATQKGGMEALKALAKRALLRYSSEAAVNAMIAEAATIGGGTAYTAGAAAAGGSEIIVGGTAMSATEIVASGTALGGTEVIVGTAAPVVAPAVIPATEASLTLLGVGVGWWALAAVVLFGAAYAGVEYANRNSPRNARTSSPPPVAAELPAGLNTPPDRLPELPPGSNALPGAAATTGAPSTVICSKNPPFGNVTGGTAFSFTGDTRVSFSDPAGGTNSIEWDTPPGSIRVGDTITLVSRSSHNPGGPPMFVRWEFGSADAPYRFANGATTKTDDEKEQQEARAGRTDTQLPYQGGSIRVTGGLYTNEPGSRFTVQWNYNCQQ